MCSRVERASQQAAVDQLKGFADIDTLVSSIRAERGFSTSVVLMKGEVATTNQIMFNQRAITDEILLKLPTWPDGLEDSNIQLRTKSDLIYMLSDVRGRVSTIAIDFHAVLEVYSRIIHLLISWILVIFPLLKVYYARIFLKMHNTLTGITLHPRRVAISITICSCLYLLLDSVEFNKRIQLVYSVYSITFILLFLHIELCMHFHTIDYNKSPLKQFLEK